MAKTMYKKRGRKSTYVNPITGEVVRASKIKRTNRGTIILPSGEKISKAEEAEYKRLVARVNARRRKQIKEEASMLVPGTKYTYGETLHKRNLTSDFVETQLSGSMTQFKNKAMFKAYFKVAKKKASKEYLSEKDERYRKNYLKAIRKNFPAKVASAVAKKVRAMGSGFVSWARQQPETYTDIGYIYDLDSQEGRARILLSLVGYTDEEVEKIIEEAY